MCNEAITVFNARLDESSGYDVYTGTTITGVSWFCEIASNVDKSGLQAANKFTIRVPIDADFGGKSYVEPSRYAESDPATTFTLRSGDIVVKGAVSEINPRPGDLHKKYADVVTVLGVTDNRRALHSRHWKVVGA